MTHSDTEQAGFLRFGYVSSYDPSEHTARVVFPAMNNVVSAPLPVCVPSSSGVFYEPHLTAGTHVACVMAGGGTEAGIVCGAFYDRTNKPPSADENIESVSFSDGSSIQYDRKNHTLHIHIMSDIEITSGREIRITGGNIRLESDNTDITAGYNLNMKSIDYTGKITVNKDITKMSVTSRLKPEACKSLD